MKKHKREIKKTEVKEDTPEVLYRYEVDYGVLKVKEYKVLRKTPKGVWIDKNQRSYCYCFGDCHCAIEKFVLLSGRKRFAYPTTEEALNNFIHRKKRYMVILESRLNIAKIDLAEAENKMRKTEGEAK